MLNLCVSVTLMWFKLFKPAKGLHYNFYVVEIYFFFSFYLCICTAKTHVLQCPIEFLSLPCLFKETFHDKYRIERIGIKGVIHLLITCEVFEGLLAAHDKWRTKTPLAASSRWDVPPLS